MAHIGLSRAGAGRVLHLHAATEKRSMQRECECETRGSHMARLYACMHVCRWAAHRKRAWQIELTPAVKRSNPPRARRVRPGGSRRSASSPVGGAQMSRRRRLPRPASAAAASPREVRCRRRVSERRAGQATCG